MRPSYPVNARLRDRPGWWVQSGRSEASSRRCRVAPTPCHRTTTARWCANPMSPGRIARVAPFATQPRIERIAPHTHIPRTSLLVKAPFEATAGSPVNAAKGLTAPGGRARTVTAPAAQRTEGRRESLHRPASPHGPSSRRLARRHAPPVAGFRTPRCRLRRSLAHAGRSVNRSR